MKKYILTVTLNPALDKTVKVPNFKAGLDHRTEGLYVNAGGKGINVSRALNILGSPNLATGILGGRTGEWIIEELKKEKIKNDFLKIDTETRTNLTIVDAEGSAITRVIERGLPIDRSALSSFKKKFGLLLKNSEYVIFSGSNATGLRDDLYCELIEMARSKAVKTVLDTRGKPLALGARARPFILKPNLEEAEYITGTKLNSLAKIKEAAKKLSSKGIEIVVITMGSAGAILYRASRTIYARPPSVKYTSHVGCGDAFLAGLLDSLAKRRSLELSLKIASASGAASALTQKSGAFNISDMKKLVRRVRIAISG